MGPHAESNPWPRRIFILLALVVAVLALHMWLSTNHKAQNNYRHCINTAADISAC